MARPIFLKKHLLPFLALVATGIVSTPVLAQDFSLNSDALSSLEEPIATDIGGVTIELTGLLDSHLDFDLDGGGDDIDPGFLGNFEISATTQLGNRWNVGVAYFGQYETDAGGDDYTDNIAGFVSGSWGTVLAGEVSNVIREETRRSRGTGNADLAFDDTYGQLENWGGGYVGQFGPARIGGIVDEDGNFDLGFTWSRPLGNKDYRFGLRYTNAEFTAADGLTAFDTQAVTGTAEFIYGSTTYSLGMGYERLDSGLLDANRWFASAGWQTKSGAFTFSADAHYGEVDGQSEIAGALGVRYDLARGLSLNLGINHSDSQIALGGVTLVDQDDTRATASLRFSF